MTAQPAWGSAPDAPTEIRYTVCGFFSASDERFADHVTIPGDHPTEAGARAAEDAVTTRYADVVGEDDVPCGFRVTGVFAVVNGQVEAFDLYAKYLDPDQTEPTPATGEFVDDVPPRPRLVEVREEIVVVEEEPRWRRSRWGW